MACPRMCGSITIELLIAFALFSVLSSGVILVSQTSFETTKALRETFVLRALVTDGLLYAREYADSVQLVATTSVAVSHETVYTRSLTATTISPCLSHIVSQGSTSRRSLVLERLRANRAESLRLGGDCDTAQPLLAWDFIHEIDFLASTTKGMAIDALGGLVVIGTDAPPYLTAYDTQTGEPIHFENGFSLYAPVNALDVVRIQESGVYKRYLFAALATSSKQLAVVDISNVEAPTLRASVSLPGVVATGSFPGGYRVMAYDAELYVLTRETAGPELHVFAIEDPSHPRALGSYAIDSTINDMMVRDEVIEGTAFRLLYGAGARDTGEVTVFNVTDPARITERTFERLDLPGAQDGRSLFVRGNRLYLGRASNTGGPELYVIDVSRASSTFSILGSGEVGSAHVTGMHVVGDIAVLAATPDGLTNRRIETWNIKDEVHPQRLYQYPLSGLAMHGIDYELNHVYATRESGNVLEILEAR